MLLLLPVSGIGPLFLLLLAPFLGLLGGDDVSSLVCGHLSIEVDERVDPLSFALGDWLSASRDG